MRNFIVSISLILLATFVATQNPELLTMPTNVGVKFTCGKASAGDNAVVKAIGDVNGDSIADIAVAFPAQGISGGGVVAIIYGGANLMNGLDVCNFNDLTVGFRIKGVGSSAFGTAIVSMGDLNGDGVSDIAVGAPAFSTNQGRVYVLYLPAMTGRQLEYSVKQILGYTLTANPAITSTGNNKLGYYLAEPQDYNGDGIVDVLVGNGNTATTDKNLYILYGQKGGSGDYQTNMLTNWQGATLNGGSATGFNVNPIASCGDLSYDGVADYLIPTATSLIVHYGVGNIVNQVINVDKGNSAVIPYGGGLTFTTTNALTCADLDNDGKPEVILTLTDPSVTPAAVNIHVLYGTSIKAWATSSQTILSKATQQGFIIASVSGTAGATANSLKKTDGWNGYGQDVLLIADAATSQIYAIYANAFVFNSSAQLSVWSIDNLKIPTQGLKFFTFDPAYKVGTNFDATMDVNGDGIKDLLIGEQSNYDVFTVFGQCQSGSNCACPNGLKYQQGQCVNWGLSGGQKVGIIVGVILGAMLLISLGVLIFKKTSLGSNCFESYAKPQFGSHTHAPIPQTMATSA